MCECDLIHTHTCTYMRPFNVPFCMGLPTSYIYYNYRICTCLYSLTMKTTFTLVIFGEIIFSGYHISLYIHVYMYIHIYITWYQIAETDAQRTSWLVGTRTTFGLWLLLFSLSSSCERSGAIMLLLSASSACELLDTPFSWDKSGCIHIFFCANSFGLADKSKVKHLYSYYILAFM